MIVRIELDQTDLWCCGEPATVGASWSGMVMLARWGQIIDDDIGEDTFSDDGIQILPPGPSVDLSQRVRVRGTVIEVASHGSVVVAVGDHQVVLPSAGLDVSVGDAITAEGPLSWDPHVTDTIEGPATLAGVVTRVQVTALENSAGRTELESEMTPMDTDEQGRPTSGWFMSVPRRWSTRSPDLRLPPYDITSTADGDYGVAGYTIDLDVDVPDGAIEILE